MSESKDHYYAEMLNMMREQGSKNNPVTLQLGTMQSSNSVKIDDLLLEADDLFIADHLLAGYSRELKTPYISYADASKKDEITYTDGLKKGDLVAVQKLNNTNMYVILAKVVEA